MTVTSRYYGRMFLSLFNKEIDWLSDDIYCMLTTSTYVPDQDTHDYLDDVTNEVVGTGYTANGQILAGKTITYTAATNRLMLDATDPQWLASTLTAAVAVLVDRTPATDATRPLIAYFRNVDSAGAVSSITTTNQPFDVIFHATGIGEVVVA